jgi:conserved oligomeric Golgi complex subunit COG5-like protein
LPDIENKQLLSFQIVMAHEEPSYIDYEAFLDPDFSATAFANKLVLSTNDPNDIPLDLSTPLSRVLFDVQEIDTHIDTLTTKSALPLLEFTDTRAKASQRILDEVESQVESLTSAYKTLEREVIERYEAAEQVRLVAERLSQAVRLARGVSRSLLLGRQLEAQIREYNGASSRRPDYRAMVRASNTLATLKALLLARKPGEEGHGLDRVTAIASLINEIILPAEKLLTTRAQQIVREFSISSLLSRTASQSTSTAPTFTQNEETKARTTSALLVLYLLSPIKPGTTPSNFEPSLAISALQEYLQTALKASLAALARSLATLPTLDRTLLELSARCQNIVALETLLSTLTTPSHPAFDAILDTNPDLAADLPPNFLQSLLQALDTSSLPSFFWRTLASALSPRVLEILNKGGVSARTLRANKDAVRESIRRCVDRGSQIPEAFGRGKSDARSWEREAAVMVAAVVGPLSR